MQGIPFTPDERTQNREGYGFAIEEWVDSQGVRIEAPTLEEALRLYHELSSQKSMDAPVPVVVGS